MRIPVLLLLLRIFSVMQLQQEIDKVREAQLAGYANRGGATEEKVRLNLTALAALDAADFSANNDDDDDDNGE